ncbi:fatty-acid synthase [Nodosilinea sp. LEGE 07088]|uniref:element excision factor XisH family protein n=1 Tax=Nodosilinea sp. LEGE 07088 TaxID=2777968 RepID=UPI001880195D|nr:element excision factor XisH family protein [Nodosilinea sp. LEGE 07088]MBE9141213.1 fatty-acid synthase [Nodosilinea sp. LEGE 07088]
MPQRDSIHYAVRQALVNDGWSITADPYVISYGERFLFIDLGAAETSGDNRIESRFIGAQRGANQIAVEVKEFRRASAIADLEQAIGQYVLYRLLLNQVDPERDLSC